MGYFDGAHVIELEDTPKGVLLARSHYGTGESRKTLFFWSEGSHPIELDSYAAHSELATIQKQLRLRLANDIYLSSCPKDFCGSCNAWGSVSSECSCSVS
jgi:hypothetical protein